jgi:16S rRNA (adenine(1408)-N(1))-methyltransferase
MVIVRGRSSVELTRAQVDALRTGYRDVAIDLGAGDGLFAYRYARAHPETLVIAIEPVRENVRDASAKAAKKPERGGAPNVVYAVASIEMLPAELRGVAGQILVTLPWGSLMRGIILGDAGVLAALASLGRADAQVRIVLNTRIFDDPVPVDARDLPELSPAYARDSLAPAFADAGLRLDLSRWLEPAEVAALGTTWAKRLSHRSPPRSLLIEATVVRGQVSGVRDQEER